MKGQESQGTKNELEEKELFDAMEPFVKELASLNISTERTLLDVNQADNPPNVIYERRILSKEGKKQLENLGYEVRDMDCSHIKVIDTALNHVSSYLYGNTNPHDSMLPCAIARGYGAVPVDISGKKISFKNTKVSGSWDRIPSVCYFAPGLPSLERQKILEVLKVKENLYENI